MYSNTRLILALLWLLLVSAPAGAQEPFYLQVGTDELWGLDIYSILEDQQGNIWLSTEDALYRYDGYTFEHYTGSFLKAKSLFNLVMDSQGQLYAANLSGQIVRVKGDSLELFYQIPDSLRSNGITISINHQDELILSGRFPLLINKQNELKVLNLNFARASEYQLFQNEDGQYLCHNLTDSFYLLDKQLKKAKAYKSKNRTTLYTTQFKDFYYLNDTRLECVMHPEKSLQLQVTEEYRKDHIYRIFLTGDGRILLGNHNKGIHFFQSDGTPLYHQDRIFNDYFISGFLEDRQGNLWFSTMGKGLLLVPNPEIESFDFLSSIKNEKLLELEVDSIGQYYVGTENGAIFRLDTNLKVDLICKVDNQPIRSLFVDVENHQLFSAEDKKLFVADLSTGNMQVPDLKISAIKKYGMFSASKVLIMDYRMFHQYDYETKVVESLREMTAGTEGRLSAMLYLQDEGVLWLGTYDGVYCLENKKVKKYSYPGKNIIITDIVKDEQDNIWLSTNEPMVLTVRGDSLVPAISIEQKSGYIEQLLVIDDYLLMAGRKGLQVYNIAQKKRYQLGGAVGLFNQRVLDFCVFKGQIALLTTSGLYRFPLALITQDAAMPQLSLQGLRIGNTPHPLSNNSFPYFRQKIEFTTKIEALQFLEEVDYAYKLEGVDEQWQYQDFEQNSIRYAALAPGKYTLRVKAVGSRGLQSPETSYAFEIQYPFWQSWWFYVISTLIGLLIMYLAFRFQLKRVQRKNREKYELMHSKLTALKSQMNPHFIFNTLNSIQDLIIKEDIENSYYYVIRFSDMMRKTLNYSEKDFVDLEEECKLISIYLELEQLRFKEDFEYTIENEVPEGVQIPPMLVQPFIENAVKHGLLHKKGMKKLHIHFYFKDTLVCEVKDNGVGRKRSAEINKHKQKSHTSFSVDAIKSRFEVLKNYYNQPLGVWYKDLDEAGIASGTLVRIQLPWKRIF